MSATALRSRDLVTGRFVAVAPLPHCASCGWIHAESLAGTNYCPNTRCDAYRKPAGTVPGVDPGVLTAADLEPALSDGEQP